MLSAVDKPADLKYTDLTRWRLKSVDGRQVWHYLSKEETESWPQTLADKYWLGLHLNVPTLPKANTPLEVARNGLTFYQRLQCEDGHFAGAYGGPHFLTPGYVIAMYIAGEPIPEHSRAEMIRFLLGCARKEDGGWGIHIECNSTCFGTALNYVTCRLLGLDRDHPAMVRARATLHSFGGAASIPSWGKFWLSVLNVYEWEGMNPVPPELWLLPYSLSVHPGRWWIHTRMVYLPMGYLYAQRFQAKETDLIRELREELYTQPYNTINWAQQRNNIAEIDVYYPHTTLLNVANFFLNLYEKFASKRLRQWAIDESWEQLRMEDENTFYGNLASVNKVMNLLCTFVKEGRESKGFRLHVEHAKDYLWMSESGMYFNGTDGSQLWDACWIVQATCLSGLAQEKPFHDMVKRTYDFIDSQQIRIDPKNRDRCYRDATKGAWPFSRRDQGYTITDCTAEAIKGIYMMHELDYIKPTVSDERLCEAVDILLRMQNDDGGFSEYEARRGPKMLEWINPAEVFGDIMVGYSYPECTTAVLLGFKSFKKRNPTYRTEEIDTAITRGIEFLKRDQFSEGGWYGRWAICFTYGTWFALEALASVGENYANSEHVRRACDWLVSVQMEDGGWGESYKSCELLTYVHHTQSQVVNTAWSVLALMAANYPDVNVIRRGIKLIASRQQPDGRWEQEAIEGVFNKNAMIAYPNYKFSFTVWALGVYGRKYGDEKLW
ncbi:Lanosterol synthase (Oxidosqualene--lanosterol cyclase) [Rhizophlyctis rosea]|nr:Lanosterol synthase (Oxidosqualene--lanosterol cyclase) [Rhizophlyctis rosea]